MLEKQIQSAILEYLTLKGIFHWRNNSGAMKTEHSFVRFGAVGSPDIFALKHGILYGIEVKRPKGKVSEAQKNFGESMVQHGARYMIAYSLDDVRKVL